MAHVGVFPGQGSQFSGLGRELESYGEVPRRVLDRAVEVLGPEIRDVMFEEGSSRLFDGYWSGLAVTVASIALWESYGGKAEMKALAGYSVGQFAALYAAGALSFTDTLNIVASRGRLLRHAAGASRSVMIGVIGLPLAKLEQVLREFPQAQISNFNAPGNYSVGCAKEESRALLSAIDLAGAIKAVELPVEGAWHSHFMTAAKEAFGPHVSVLTLNRPAVPVYSNVTATAPADGEWKTHLVEHVSKPVLWQETILNMGRAGFRSYVEFSMRPQLASFIKFTDRSSRIVQSVEKADE